MNEDSSNYKKKNLIEGQWTIRPCFIYEEEYNDCKSFKARFHQYFIHGKLSECGQWNEDYENCTKFEESNGNDITAGNLIIQSEENRRKIRWNAHFENDTWTKRKNGPPADWNAPLPEWLINKNANTLLEIKAKEFDGLTKPTIEETSYCVVM